MSRKEITKDAKKKKEFGGRRLWNVLASLGGSGVDVLSYVRLAAVYYVSG